GAEGARHRFVAPGGPLGTVVDVRVDASASAGRQGAGSVHHVAFRAADDLTQQDMADAARNHDRRPTARIDRDCFHSVYFREPGGILLEIATDGPGLTV